MAMNRSNLGDSFRQLATKDELVDSLVEMATAPASKPIGPPHLKILNVGFLKPQSKADGAQKTDDWE
jgi:hypothetical protein